MSKKMHCDKTTPGHFCIRPHGHEGACAFEKMGAQPAPSRQWGQLRNKQATVVPRTEHEYDLVHGAKAEAEPPPITEGIPWNCVVPTEVLNAALLLSAWTERMGFRHWRIAGCANAEKPNHDMKLSPGHVSAPAVSWDYDMERCPVGVKCLLLNLGGCATFGPVDARSKKFFVAWAPLPQRDKAEEARRGLNR